MYKKLVGGVKETLAKESTINRIAIINRGDQGSTLNRANPSISHSAEEFTLE